MRLRIVPEGLASSSVIPCCGYPLKGVGRPLKVSPVFAPQSDAALLLNSALTGTVAAALGAWQAAGAGEDDLNRLRGVDFRIVELPGNLIGMAFDDAVCIDPDAAGFGWFIQPLPGEGPAFAIDESGLWRAEGRSSARRRVDLLSVISHEFGHILGLDDRPCGQYSPELMSAELPPGIRRLPTASNVAALPTMSCVAN